MGSMTYEADPHPLLDLSPMEQVVLLKAERSQLRTAVVSLSEGEAIKHLKELRLIEVQDDLWFPTEGRGGVVARVLDRLELARVTRRSTSAVEKKIEMFKGIRGALDELLAEVENLPA